jgi:tetratricopeptide (TPR) repeat protein
VRGTPELAGSEHPSSGTPAALVRHARQLIEKAEFAAAERLVSEALDGKEIGSGHTELLYALAVARRYRGNAEQALDTLQDLTSIDPAYGRAFQEKGHALLALGRAEQAREAYEDALRLNPALPGSWRALARIYEESGLPRQRRAALEQLERLTNLPEELLAVTSMIHEGRLYKAERVCRRFLRRHPHHVEAMRLLAAIGNELGILTDAEFLLESCLEFAPDYDQARYDYANLLLKMQKFERAHEQTQILAEKEPGNLAYLSLLANAAAGVGDHHNAIGLYNEVLEKAPRQNMLYVMRGHAEKTVGDLDAAVESYRQAYRIRPNYGDAYWSLANTKTYRFTDGEIGQMTAREASDGVPTEDRIHLCFALGKALEDRGEFERSFEYYARGNALKQALVRHRSGHLNIRIGAQIEVCSTSLFERRKGVGCPDPGPIFIVGMPRAGSTLLEQILASHSRVKGTFELPNIIALAQRLRGSYQLVDEDSGRPRYPQVLADLEEDYFRRFGEQYIDDTRVYRFGADHFIDKNPNNFFHVGLIRLILPNARVIDARRHPMSCCFSCFRQLFGQGQEFSYGLETLGNYYREYVELMDHWDRVLPGFVLRVRYEDVVSDLETQVRRVLAFCGLEFEEACLEFHQTRRSVRTPSSEQVRQPIYRSGLDYWRNYQPWLDPLREALGPEVRSRYGIGSDGA